MDNQIHLVSEASLTELWDITKEINENIRHYNDQQIRYRGFASQWLLGAFAAIGFILVSTPAIPFDKMWLVFGVAFVAALGVYQLWRMDTLVFGTLISTYFNAGKEIENNAPALPQIKHATFDNMRNNNTGQTLFVFYYIIIFVFSAICAGILVYMIPDLRKTPWLITSITVTLIFLRSLYRLMWKRSAGIKRSKPANQ